MKVCEAFIGQRVQPSQYGLDWHPRWSAEFRGTVIGFSKQFTWCIRVQRDDVKYPDNYHAGFWEPVPSQFGDS